MNSKEPNIEFHVDIDKAIDQFSNMSKCLDRKWNTIYEKHCDENCDECEYMYGSGNSGQIKNLFENVQEWLEELKALRLLLEWAIECDFGLDCFPEEYEMFKHTLNDDMSNEEMMIQIAKEYIAEELKESK